jgi:hypothetical protein
MPAPGINKAAPARAALANAVAESLNEEAAPARDLELELYPRGYYMHGNTAYGRGEAFTTSYAEAREILGNEMIELADAREDAGTSFDVVPYSAEELRAMKGEYVLVAVPQLDFGRIDAIAGKIGVEVSVAIEKGCYQTVRTTPGWYAVRKSLYHDFPAADRAIIPSRIGALELLYSAVAAQKALGHIPFGGATAITAWMCSGIRALTIINKFNVFVDFGGEQY